MASPSSSLSAVVAILAILCAFFIRKFYQHEQVMLEELADLRKLLLEVRSVVPQCSTPSSSLAEYLEPSGKVDTDRLLFEPANAEFVIVSDLDRASRDPQRFSWHALVQRGILRQQEGGRYHVEWLGQKTVESTLSVKNRSMELSELVWFDGRLLGMCDITGLVFELSLEQGRALQRWILSDGDGNAVKPFKSEWATVKDGALLIGSMGREWVRDDGTVESFNNQWIKTIDRHGRVRSVNWRPVYEALRSAANATSPGYLWHEAVTWDARLRKWLFLPRKASESEPYTPESDELRGTNLLILASEDFSDIEVRRLGPLEAEYGFTSLRKVPGTADVYMALKVLEVGTRTETRITVFDLQGNFLMDPPFQDVGTAKYEGLAFLGEAR